MASNLTYIRTVTIENPDIADSRRTVDVLVDATGDHWLDFGEDHEDYEEVAFDDNTYIMDVIREGGFEIVVDA